MKIKILWGNSGKLGLLRKGQIVDTDEAHAKHLIYKSLAEEIKEKKKPEQNKAAAPKKNKSK